MKALKTLRWFLFFLITWVAIFYISLSRGTKSKEPYIISRSLSDFALTGDYNSLITIRGAAHTE